MIFPWKSFNPPFTRDFAATSDYGRVVKWFRCPLLLDARSYEKRVGGACLLRLLKFPQRRPGLATGFPGRQIRKERGLQADITFHIFPYDRFVGVEWSRLWQHSLCNSLFLFWNSPCCKTWSGSASVLRYTKRAQRVKAGKTCQCRRCGKGIMGYSVYCIITVSIKTSIRPFL